MSRPRSFAGLSAQVRLSVLACAFGLPLAGVHAQPGQPLMTEPIEYTDVQDAFDGDDPIDVGVSLTFHRVLQAGTLQREVVDERTADGRSTRAFIDVAEHERTSNELSLGLELGVYHDLMLYGRLPILLGEERELGLPDGESCRPGGTQPEVCSALDEPVAGEQGEAQRLFDHGVVSAKRSGIPRVDFGVAWAPLNQHRGSLLGTWVLRAETSLAVGPVMRPCLQGGDCAAGVSRGTGALQLESRWSYRYRYLAPYFGLGHRHAWVTSGEDVFAPGGELAGDVDPRPPSSTFATLGMVAIPFEDRGRYQRFAIDTRGSATMVSSGRDFTPLFDALGTSSSEYLTAPNAEQAQDGGGRVREVGFTGLTRVQAHLRLELALELVMQAARYVRFTLGTRLAFLTPHLLTGELPCNRELEADPEDPRAGACVSGIENPAHRPVIDAPGQRFRLNTDMLVDLSISALGRF